MRRIDFFFSLFFFSIMSTPQSLQFEKENNNNEIEQEYFSYFVFLHYSKESSKERNHFQEGRRSISVKFHQVISNIFHKKYKTAQEKIPKHV